MAKRPKYDDKFRANAVVLLEAAGYPNKPGALNTTAKRLGVHDRTLSRWARQENNPPPSELVTEKRGELSDLLRKEIDEAIHAMGDARQEASYRDLVTAVAIMIDKLQLLAGEPTDNNRTRIVIEYADTDANASQPA